MSLWGYNAQATEDALRVIARSVTARDVEIATLRKELADLRSKPPVRNTGPAVPPASQAYHPEPSGQPPWPRLPGPGPGE